MKPINFIFTYFLLCVSLAADPRLIMRVTTPGIGTKDDKRDFEFFFYDPVVSHDVATNIPNQHFSVVDGGKKIIFFMMITNWSMTHEGEDIQIIRPLSEIGHMALKAGKAVQLGKDTSIKLSELKKLQEVEVYYFISDEYGEKLKKELSYTFMCGRDEDGRITFSGKYSGTFSMQLKKEQK